MRACAMFVKMADDFFEFVQSYRCGDAVSIEKCYHNFVPVWRDLGQTRYLERTWRQDEQL